MPADNLIGKPGDGFVLAQKRLGGGRIHHAMRWIGQAASAPSTSCASAPSRASPTASCSAQHQMVQDYIGAVADGDRGGPARHVPDGLADGHGRRAAVRAELGMVEGRYVSHDLLAVLDRAIQVCGALGYSSDLPLEDWYRTNRFGPIGDGPDEVHKSVLARTLLKGVKPVEGWPTEHIPSRRPAAEAKWAELRTEAGVA